MCAVHTCLIRQGQQLGQGGPHLLGGALKQAATAQSKQRVTWEQRLCGGYVEGDVAARVARGVKHVHLMRPETKLVAVRHPCVDAWDARFISLGADNGEAGVEGLEVQVGTHMIPMVVCVEDVGQLPALGTEGGLHRLQLSRVHHSGEACLWLVQ
eukprot:CAMPEP_0202893384 /NCGR_PEP_ID=MMETSP1392-20130828/2976_1 /ASSEMBLY_ACC=CAM_ASM_000868 /TAXON_ID=225041 /ORGANISM="Chlamydomonas chlamydogama, Strain SAG 11-48b" /LENGTH=154 /DNA_ID=CAMNT_0049577697 /DNA_START=792 /DNA_END=1256 /DNA_ORIENTATION=+